MLFINIYILYNKAKNINVYKHIEFIANTMDGDRWKYWEGKKVYIILKNKRQYSGKVIEVETNLDSVWITILDKFDKRIGFYVNEIEIIQEENDRNSNTTER